LFFISTDERKISGFAGTPDEKDKFDLTYFALRFVGGIRCTSQQVIHYTVGTA
jgi:hypothetical protein